MQGALTTSRTVTSTKDKPWQSQAGFVLFGFLLFSNRRFAPGLQILRTWTYSCLQVIYCLRCKKHRRIIMAKELSKTWMSKAKGHRPLRFQRAPQGRRHHNDNRIAGAADDQISAGAGSQSHSDVPPGQGEDRGRQGQEQPGVRGCPSG